MRRTWLILALTSAVLPACFGSHGTNREDDAGPRVDTGTCLTLPAIVQTIRCNVEPSGEAVAMITTSPSQCCGSGSVTPTLSASGSSFDVALAWNACDCCEGCRCIGPTEEVRVSLGALEPGTYTVRSEGSSCNLLVPRPEACHASEIDEFRAPTVLFEDQPLAMTLIEREASSCHCQPRAVLEGSFDVRLQRCDCCDACSCIDPGYEASLVTTAPSLGAHTFMTPLGARVIHVTTRDPCRALEPTGLRIVSPDPELRSSGPAIHWAVVSGVEQLCCVPPAPAIDQGVGPAGQISLDLRTCVQEDCDCIGEQVEFEAWHPLVALESSIHVIRAGRFETTIMIP